MRKGVRVMRKIENCIPNPIASGCLCVYIWSPILVLTIGGDHDHHGDDGHLLDNVVALHHGEVFSSSTAPVL